MTDLQNYIHFKKGLFDPVFCKVICDDLQHIDKHKFYGVGDLRGTVGKDPMLCKLQTEQYGHTIIDQQYDAIFNYLKDVNCPWFETWAGYTWPKFIEYNKGEHLKNHCDHIYEIFLEGDKPRGVPILTMITCLNEYYTGGDMVLCNKYRYKFKIGDTIIFPSNFIFPHCIEEIKSGKRVSMTTWIY